MDKTSVVRESVEHGLEAMRSEMGYGEAPPLERLLIDQIVLTWLHYYKMEHSYLSTIEAGTTVGRSTGSVF